MIVYLDASNSSKNYWFDTWIVSHSSTEILTQLWLKFLFLRSRHSFGVFFKTSEIVLMVKLRRRPFDFWGEGGEGYGWFQKEISCRLILRGKNILRRNTWGKTILHRKHTGICWGKKFRGLGKRSLTQTKSPIAPHKSNGRLLMRFPQEC